MTVEFNLRSGRKNSGINEAPALGKIICALGAAFFALSLLFFVYGGYKLHSLKTECAEIRKNLDERNDRILLLDREYSTIKERNDDIESRYDFVLQGIPAMEFLSGLVDAVPDGVIIESVSIGDVGCSLKGIAFDDEEILEFTEKLNTVSAVAHVALPVITAEKINGASLKKYSVEITLNSLAEILTAPTDEASADTTEEDAQ